VSSGRRRGQSHPTATLFTDDGCAAQMIDSKQNEALPVANDDVRRSPPISEKSAINLSRIRGAPMAMRRLIWGVSENNVPGRMPMVSDRRF
jgi:hypothetical protein